MKLTHSTLIATTALGLSMAAAHAGDGNSAFLGQKGADNSASIVQTGDNNATGSAVRNAGQSGNNNLLTIDQVGSNNSIGLGGNADSGTGMTQTSSNTGTKQSNKMFITQTSDGNTVGSAVQNSSGQGYNTATITQGGGGGNTVGSLYQRQSSSVTNLATITQNGTNNTLARVSQNARVGGAYNPNEIDVTMDGSDNGGASALSLAAAATGALSSTLIQGTDLGTRGNKINLDVSGTNNQFGVSQYGNDNTVGTLTIAGDANEVGVYQQGSYNSLTLNPVGGMGNNLGLLQNGNYNTANLAVTGDYNGGANFFDAGSAAGTLALSVGLTEGLMEQSGDGNGIDLTVSGDNNVFATRQASTGTGSLSGNTIIGTQDSTGALSGNQVAVLQTGQGNATTFSQIGGSNNLAVSQ